MSENDTKKLRAVGYARVSSENQDREGYSLDQQERILRETMEQDDGVEMVEEPIKDGGESGTNFSRDGIQRVFELASNGEIDVVYVTKLNRLGRCAPESLYFIYLLRNDLDITIRRKDKHIDIVSSLEDLLTTTLSLLIGHFAMEQRVTTSLESSRDQFREDRNWWVYYNEAPLGYEPSEDDDWIQRCRDEEKIVREMFREFIKTESYAKTARHLTKWYRRDGYTFTLHQVRRNLQRTVYIGEPSVSIDTERLDETEIVVMDIDLLIVAPDKFQKAQEIIKKKENKRQNPDEEEPKDPLDFVEIVGLETMLCSFANLTLQCTGCESTGLIKNGRRTSADLRVHNYRCTDCGKQMKWPKGHQITKLRKNGDL